MRRNNYLKDYFIIYIIKSIFKSFKKSFTLKKINLEYRKEDTIRIYKGALEKFLSASDIKGLTPKNGGINFFTYPNLLHN